MKILDEKGRLFGKINIVDFLIIFLIAALIPIFFQIYKILDDKPRDLPYEWVRVEIVTFTLPEFVDIFKIGVISHDGFGNPDGKLIKVLKKDPDFSSRLKDSMISRYSLDEKIYKINTQYEHRIPVFLELELLCTKTAKSENWYFRRSPLLPSLDSGFNYYADNYHIFCYVIKIKG